ncbi:MAG: bifunctional oligoribonuclease/PAP phosphatase NrnA [Acidobacteriota bacterium]
MIQVLDQIAEVMRRGSRFMLTSHRRPDGDSIGSELAIAFTLEQLGKEAVIRNRDPHPSAYRRIPGVDRILVGDCPEGEVFDAVFVIECTEVERPGLSHLDRYFLINIDHHSKNRMFANLNWVDTAACAVGEMIYRLVRHLGVRLTPEIATALYVSISTDTGFFHFSNTNARTFEVCAELAKAGADPAYVADALTDHNRPGQIQLLGRCLSRLELHWDLRAATIALFLSDLAEIEVTEGDTENIINYPRSIDGIDVAVFYKEIAPGDFRVGFRSKTDFDVAALAAEFGGGGHAQASGCSVSGSYEEVRRKVLGALRKRLGMPQAVAADPAA